MTMPIVHSRAPEVRVSDQSFHLRSTAADGKYLEGVAVPFDRWQDVGPYDERFQPGVFDTTLSRSPDRVPLLVNHDVSAIAVGRPVEWIKDTDALRGVWKFDSRAEAQEVARMAEDGILTGLSVHFQPGRKKADNTVERVDQADGKTPRMKVTRHNARLLEVSLVSVPAYEGAEISLVRTAGITADLADAAAGTPRADDARAALQDLRAKLSDLTKGA